MKRLKKRKKAKNNPWPGTACMAYMQSNYPAFLTHVFEQPKLYNVDGTKYDI